MEINKEELERWREWYATMLLENPHFANAGTMTYIYELEKTLGEYEHYLRAFNKLPPETEVLSINDYRELCPHPGSEKTLVQVSNSSGETTPSTVNEDAILMTENLAQPSSVSTSTGIEVNREPEPFIVASSVESGEQFSGADIEKAGGSHRKNSNDKVVSLQYVRKLLVEIASEHDCAIVMQCDSSNYESSDSRVMLAVRDCRLTTLNDFVVAVLEKLK